MRLLTKFSLYSFAALVIVTVTLAYVSVRTFDDQKEMDSGEILRAKLTTAVRDIDSLLPRVTDDALIDVIRADEKETGARLVVYRTDGRLLYPQATDLDRSPPPLPPVVSQTPPTANGITQWLSKGPERWLASWQPIDGRDLLVGAYLPEQVVRASRARFLTIVSVAALVITVAAMMGLFFFGRHFSSRVTATLNALDAIRDGSFGVRITTPDTGDELSQVQRRINEMSETFSHRARERDAATGWLQENEQRFRDFAESTADAFWETDADLRYTWFHNAGRHFPDMQDDRSMIGKKRGEFLYTLEFNSDDWTAHLQDLEKRLPFRDFYFSGLYTDGTQFHRSASGTPYYDDDGNFAGYRGTTTNVSARVETERRLGNLVANIPGLVFQHLVQPDDTFEFLYLSGQTKQLFETGSDSDLRSAAAALEHVHPDDRERVRRAIVENARALISTKIEFRHLRPDGDVTWMQLNNAAPTLRQDGALVVDGFSTDITTIKQAEEDSRTAEERLHSFTSAASDTVWETDVDHRIVWMSDPERNNARYFRKEMMVGMRRWEYPNIDPPDSPLWQGHIDDLMNHRPFRDFEFETRLENGNAVFRRISGHPVFDSEGVFTGYRGVSTDITDRIATERAARAGEQRMIDAVQATTQGIALFDSDDRLVFINEAFYDLQSLDATIFVVGDLFDQIMDRAYVSGGLMSLPEHQDKWLERRRAYHENPNGIFATVQLHDRFVEVRDERLTDGGSMIRLTDVSAQTEARNALALSEDRFRSFAESSSDWMWETDKDFRYIWHTEDQRPGGALRDSAIGITPWEYLGADMESHDGFRQLLERMLKHQPFRDFRYSRVGDDGSIFHRSTSGLPYFDGDGNFLGYRGTSSDVTDQVDAELRYRNLIEQMPAPLIVHLHDVILFANSAALTLFGATEPEQVIGMSILEFVHPDDRELFLERMNTTISDGTVSELTEQRRLRLDGTEISVITRGVPIMWEGERAVLGTQIDITDRVRAERQYRQLIEQAPMPVSIDDGRVFVFANQAFADLVALPGPAQVIGRQVLDTVHPDDLDEFEHRTELLTEHRQALPSIEVKRRRFDGETITVLNRGVPIMWEGDPARLAIQFDITDRIAAQDALKDSEERFRNLVEGSRQGVLLHSDFTPLFANRGLADIFGYDSVEEILSLDSALALVAPEEIETWREYRQARLDGLEAPESYEFGGIKKDGSRIWLHITVRVVAWEGKTALQGTMIDITDQRLAVEAIRDNEERFRVLTAMSPVGIFVTDPDGNCEYINEAYQNMSGLTSDDAEGQGWLSSIHPEDRDQVTAEWLSAIRLNKAYRSELRFLRPDGVIVWGIAQASAQRDMVGNVVNFIGAVTDVTARREAEEALESSEERFRTLTLVSPVGVFLTDPEGNVEYVNEALSRLLAIPAPNAIGGGWINGVHADDRRKLLTAWSEAVSTEGDLQVEIRTSGKDGEESWAIVQASPLRTQTGTVTGYVGAVTDVTDRRFAEEQLRQVQKMDAVGQLTGGIAHDFNNLLAIVQGNLELLRERASEEPRVRSLIEAAHGAARRGATLNQRLLAFARRQPLRPEKCDINVIVEDMAGLFVRTLGENIELETDYAAGLWHAKVDPNGLETAVLNLAINARDAMPDGGLLTITTANATYGPHNPVPAPELRAGDYVFLRVSDTGTGMDAETIQKAFDPFFTTKGVGKGSGLGLSMVYGFAHQSGGHVTIESVEGTGTSITLYFLRDTEDTPVHMPHEITASPPGNRECILVVEDDGDVRNMAMGMFDSLNYEAIEATNADEAMAILADRDDIALMFTDVILGNGETGPDLARRARQKFPGLRILFTSGYTQTEFENGNAIELGALINKPYERAELAEAIQAALQTARA